MFVFFSFIPQFQDDFGNTPRHLLSAALPNSNEGQCENQSWLKTKKKYCSVTDTGQPGFGAVIPFLARNKKLGNHEHQIIIK